MVSPLPSAYDLKVECFAPYRNESFTVQVNGDTKELRATVFDHKSFGKDKSLGEADIDVRWRCPLRIEHITYVFYRSGVISDLMGQMR